MKYRTEKFGNAIKIMEEVKCVEEAKDINNKYREFIYHATELEAVNFLINKNLLEQSSLINQLTRIDIAIRKLRKRAESIMQQTDGVICG